MKITFDAKWRLPVGMESDNEHVETPAHFQRFRVIGSDGEVLGQVLAKFIDEELMSLALSIVTSDP